MNKVLKALTITVLVLIIIAALVAVPNIYLYANRKNHGTFAAELGINYLLDFVSEQAIDKLVEKTDPGLILVLGDTVLTQRNDIETRAFASYAEANKGKHVKIDYFAVSLPDLLVWEQDLDERNDAFCDYVNGLAEKILDEVRQ